MKKYESYNDSRKRNKESLYNLLVMKKIIKALKEKYDRQIKTNDTPKVGIRKYIAKWTEPLVIVTIILAFFTYRLFKEAANQNSITKESSTEAQKEFDATHKADLQFRREAIYRASYCKFFPGSDSIKLNYQIQNLTDRYVEIDYIRHKWSFDTSDLSFFQDTSNIVDKFSKIKGWQTVFEDGNGLKYCGKEYFPSYEFHTVQKGKDSANLDKCADELFIDAHYHVRNTPERFRFLYVARIKSVRDTFEISVAHEYYSGNIREE